MNLRNAWGFLSIGLVMGFLPVVAPTWFPPTGIDGTSARALWLVLMGGVQMLLGGVVVLWEFAVPATIRWLAFVPPAPATVLAYEPETAEPEFDQATSIEAA